jgi:hypothetical protein
MLVLIQNMAESVSGKKLHQIVNAATKRSWFPFRQRGSIENLDIIRVQVRDNLIMGKLADEQVAERNVPDGA